jgi:hypothetical protein
MQITNVFVNCYSRGLQQRIRTLNCMTQESELLYHWRFTAYQFVLATSPLRPRTSNSFQLSLCNILSDERMGLSFTIIAGPRQGNNSRFRDPRHSWPDFTASDSRLPPNCGAMSLYLYPPGSGWPSYTPGTAFPFHRLLRLAGLRWRYSNPPPNGLSRSQMCVRSKVNLDIWTRNHNVYIQSRDFVFHSSPRYGSGKFVIASQNPVTEHCPEVVEFSLFLHSHLGFDLLVGTRIHEKCVYCKGTSSSADTLHFNI